MITPEDGVGMALDVARQGLQAGKMPIGAVVLLGDRVVGRAFTQEQALRRRVVHTDLLAMIEADTAMGFDQQSEPLTLAVNLEPCLMCMGAAITLGVHRILVGGLRREDSRELFAEYAHGNGPAGMREWTRTLCG